MSRSWYLLLGTALVSACSGGSGSVPRYFPVPEGAENPIVMQYSGATVAQVTNIVAKVCSDIPISTAQFRPAAEPRPEEGVVAFGKTFHRLRRPGGAGCPLYPLPRGI